MKSTFGETKMEVEAVYWEPKIKTYGFDVSRDLSLLLLVFQKGEAASWGGRIGDLEKSGFHFLVALMHLLEDRFCRIALLLKRAWEKPVLRCLGNSDLPDESITVVSPVELITFHGPHFGDRPGIAHAAFKALKAADIPLLGSACSVSNVSLILPENKAEEALLSLNAAFQTPPKQIHRIKGPLKER